MPTAGTRSLSRELWSFDSQVVSSLPYNCHCCNTSLTHLSVFCISGRYGSIAPVSASSTNGLSPFQLMLITMSFLAPVISSLMPDVPALAYFLGACQIVLLEPSDSAPEMATVCVPSTAPSLLS